MCLFAADSARFSLCRPVLPRPFSSHGGTICAPHLLFPIGERWSTMTCQTASVIQGARGGVTLNAALTFMRRVCFTFAIQLAHPRGWVGLFSVFTSNFVIDVNLRFGFQLYATFNERGGHTQTANDLTSIFWTQVVPRKSVNGSDPQGDEKLKLLP